ncbi:hypothetical protein Tco_0518028 [Tanacetum coccineum]
MTQEIEQGATAVPKPITTTATIIAPKAKWISFRELVECTTKTTPTLVPLNIKDKGKAKLVEPEAPLKQKDQIRIDEELARWLHAEEQEAARLKREKVESQEQANLALIEEWDNMQAMMEADYELCKRLQEQEQGELTIEEKSKLFMELMNKRKRHFARLRAKERRRKLKNKSFEEIQKAFDKTMSWINSFKPMDSEKKAERNQLVRKEQGMSRNKNLPKGKEWRMIKRQKKNLKNALSLLLMMRK